MLKLDPSQLVRPSIVVGITALGVFAGILVGGGLVLVGVILGVFFGVMFGYIVGPVITERDVDKQKVGGRTRDCDVCAKYFGTMNYNRYLCSVCNGSGKYNEPNNADPECNKCRGSGKMKQKKISLTTCSCVLVKFDKLHS